MRTPITIIFISLFLGIVYNQCDTCHLFQSVQDCESGINNIRCQWFEDSCVQTLCPAFKTPETCYQQNDGSRCYWHSKRKCQKLTSCTLIDSCQGVKWCKPILNAAWCVDEISFLDFQCVQKLDEESCTGQDGANELLTCQWEEGYCQTIEKNAPCAEFLKERECGLSWHCLWNKKSNACVERNCTSAATSFSDCTTVQVDQTKFQPCYWNQTSTQCQEQSPSSLDSKQCSAMTSGTYTWSASNKECVSCQNNSATLTLAMIFGILIAILY